MSCLRSRLLLYGAMGITDVMINYLSNFLSVTAIISAAILEPVNGDSHLPDVSRKTHTSSQNVIKYV